MAIDRSTAILPKHNSIVKEFGITNFGPYADSPRSIAKLSVLYDVLNLTVLDAQIGRYDTSERSLACQHLVEVKPDKDLLLFDRGYPSLSFMYEMQQQGVNYLIRMREDWWLEVREMLKNGETDKVITFTLPKAEKHLLNQYSTDNDKIKCRLVAVQLADGATEV